MNGNNQSMDEITDFVITWVDDSDPKWQKEYSLSSTIQTKRHGRSASGTSHTSIKVRPSWS